jgi:hypothetical protein
MPWAGRLLTPKARRYSSKRLDPREVQATLMSCLLKAGIMQQSFARYACVGDSIWWQRAGFHLQARIEYDMDSRPEDQGHDPEDQAYGEEGLAICEAWQNDEWFYCGIVVTAFYQGIRVADHAASLWGIECNFPGSDNSYINEVAAELEGEALMAAREALQDLRQRICGA